MRKLSLLLVIVVGMGLQGCTVGMAQGCYDETEMLYVEKLEISKRDLGEEHPNTLMHMTSLAILYEKQGRYDEAEPLYLQTLEISKRILGDEHPFTLKTMNRLKILNEKQGERVAGEEN